MHTLYTQSFVCFYVSMCLYTYFSRSVNVSAPTLHFNAYILSCVSLPMCTAVSTASCVCATSLPHDPCRQSRDAIELMVHDVEFQLTKKILPPVRRESMHEGSQPKRRGAPRPVRFLPSQQSCRKPADRAAIRQVQAITQDRMCAFYSGVDRSRLILLYDIEAFTLYSGVDRSCLFYIPHRTLSAPCMHAGAHS